MILLYMKGKLHYNLPSYSYLCFLLFFFFFFYFIIKCFAKKPKKEPLNCS